MKAGAASVLYYSDRLIQFPLGVFGIAMATVVFPLFQPMWCGRTGTPSTLPLIRR